MQEVHNNPLPFFIDIASGFCVCPGQKCWRLHSG